MNAHAEKMDRMYRRQRHIYDLTRKYYLFGRDRLLRSLPIETGSRVLEMGCGTGRNLIALARLHPEARLFGIDISAEMLASARAQIEKRLLAGRIVVRHSPAEAVDHARTFGLTVPFDVVFFSYSLTMMPTWREALAAGLANLRTGGTLAIVDFCDQGGWPVPVRRMLAGWLDLFDVKFRPELLETIAAFPPETAQIRTIGGRYAFLAFVRKKIPKSSND